MHAHAYIHMHMNAHICTDIYDKLFKHVKNVIPEKNQFEGKTTHIPKN
jgi:hypothetical protein